MTRLFWKIFLSFWLTLILIMGLVTWTNLALDSRFGDAQVPERMTFFLRGNVERAADMVRRGGVRGLRRMTARTRMLFVFDAAGNEMFGRPVPPELADLDELIHAASHRSHRAFTPDPVPSGWTSPLGSRPRASRPLP